MADNTTTVDNSRLDALDGRMSSIESRLESAISMLSSIAADKGIYELVNKLSREQRDNTSFISEQNSMVITEVANIKEVVEDIQTTVDNFETGSILVEDIQE
jgi:hypothetical protein